MSKLRKYTKEPIMVSDFIGEVDGVGITLVHDWNAHMSKPGDRNAEPYFMIDRRKHKIIVGPEIAE